MTGIKDLRVIKSIDKYKQQTKKQIKDNIAQILIITNKPKNTRNISIIYNFMHLIIACYFSNYSELLKGHIFKISEYLNNYGDEFIPVRGCSNHKVDKNEEIKKLLVYLIENGFNFIPNYMTYLMNENRDMIDIILKNYNNRIDYNFLVNINPKHLTSELLIILFNVKKTILDVNDNELIFFMDYVISKNVNAPFIENLRNLLNILLLRSKIKITESITEKIAKHFSVIILKNIINKGGILTTQVLENACLSLIDRYEKVKFILENKIEPTKKAFDNILFSKENNFKDDKRKTINLLTQYGYLLTYDELKLTLTKNITFDNIDKYNIKFDMSYLYICYEIGTFPYGTKNLMPDLKCLAIECKKKGLLSNIKKLVNTYKLIPDSECMIGACMHSSNLQTIKYLISKGGKVDLNCLKSLVILANNKTLTYIFEEYEKNNKSIINVSNVVKDIKQERTETQIKKEDKNNDEIQIINSISLNNIYNNIPLDICKLLKLKTRHNINYIDFRNKMIEYLNANNLINETVCILKEPFLYNGSDKIKFNKINDWICFLLKNNISDNVNEETEIKERIKAH